jgi:hypothetical protein
MRNEDEESTFPVEADQRIAGDGLDNFPVEERDKIVYSEFQQ